MKISPISIFLNDTKKSLKERGGEPKLPINSLPNFNRKIWGIPPGKLTVVGARTSQGKTAFILQLALDILEKDKSVLYLSFEMTQEEILERMFCNRHHINNWDLITGKFNKYEKEWEEYSQYIKSIRLVIADSFGRKWEDLNTFFNKLSSTPDVVILDYIQAISGSSLVGKAFIDEYIRNFKIMALKNNFAGIVVSQLNRETESKEDGIPKAHNLKGSGFLEEHSDLIILLDWHGKRKGSSEYTVNVEKNRNGPTGFIKMDFFPEYYLFKDQQEESIPKASLTKYKETVKEMNLWQKNT